MILRSGTVVSATAATCRVALRRDHCAVCPVKGSADDATGPQWRCGVGFAFPREIELGAGGVARGDCVLIGVPRIGMALAAAVVFGLPLGLMLVAAAVAQALSGAALAGAVVGLMGGGALSLGFGRRAGFNDWVQPVLVQVRARQTTEALVQNLIV